MLPRKRRLTYKVRLRSVFAENSLPLHGRLSVEYSGHLYAYAKRNNKNGRHLLLTVCFYKRKKAEFCVCFDEACTASTQYTQRLPSSKIYPFSSTDGGFALRAKPMVCVTAASLVTPFLYNNGHLCTHAKQK